MAIKKASSGDGDAEADAILSSIASIATAPAQELNIRLVRHLSPLDPLPRLPLAHSLNKENSKSNSHALGHSQAKHFLPFLVRVLKCSSSVLGQLGVPGESQENFSAVDELFGAMQLALEGLERLRPWLVGSPFEIEMQWYGMLRRLMYWKRYEKAMAECERLFDSLCSYVLSFVTGPDKNETKQKKIETRKSNNAVRDLQLALPPIKDLNCLPTGLGTLVVGVGIDLIVCSSELNVKDITLFHKLSLLPSQLEPWIRSMDPTVAKKQEESMFKALYKATSMIITEISHFKAPIVQKFCFLTLAWCRISSNWEQYYRVARKLCSILSSYDPVSTLEVCASIFRDILSSSKDPSSSFEILDFVDYYAKLCQSSKMYNHGQSYLYKLVPINGKLPPLLRISGLYAFGLGVQAMSTDKNGDSILSINDFEDAVSTVENMVTKLNKPLEGKDKSLSGDIGKSLVCLFKALDYVRKATTDYVQQEWSSFIFQPNDYLKAKCSKLNTHLRKVLHIYCQVMDWGMRYDMSPDDKEVFMKGAHLAPVAAVAALKLSLIMEEQLEASIMHIHHLITSNHLQIEELQWLMSATYNMGVQVFNNNKHYSLASEPLGLAYHAAWSRVGHLQLEGLEKQSCSVQSPLDGVVLEACSKTVSFVDALLRGGRYTKASSVILEALAQWGRAHALMPTFKSPQPLFKLWMKVIVADEVAGNTTVQAENYFFNYLTNIVPSLPPKTIGALLEEEVAAYEDIGSANLWNLRERSISYLLNEVYVGDEFKFERARILLERSRTSRAQGAQNLCSCITFLSEAISLLKEEQNLCEGNLLLHMKVQNQLATTFCMRACCAQEAYPHRVDFLEDIKHAIKEWKAFLHDFTKAGGRNSSSGNTLDDVWSRESVTLLLMNVADLLALKGYYALQLQVQRLVVHIASSAKMQDTEDQYMAFWKDSRVSHVLCHVPFPKSFSSMFFPKFGEKCSSLEFWYHHAAKLPGSFLHLQLSSMYEASLENQSPFPGNSKGLEKLESLVESLQANGTKTSQAVCNIADIHGMLAEQFLENGNICKAVHHAKESCQFRLKLLNHTFHSRAIEPSDTAQVGRSSGAAQATASTSDGAKYEVVGRAAISSWPLLGCSKVCSDPSPSQWRIMGDYIESLMQVGMLQQKLGFVDDAEKSFREGLKISEAQGLPLAEATFSSCLGELHRKRQLWDIAERDFERTRHIFSETDLSLICEACLLAERAELARRYGDLVRRRSDVSDPTANIVRLQSALMQYNESIQDLAKLYNCFGVASNAGIEDIKMQNLIVSLLSGESQTDKYLCNPCGNCDDNKYDDLCKHMKEVSVRGEAPLPRMASRTKAQKQIEMSHHGEMQTRRSSRRKAKKGENQECSVVEQHEEVQVDTHINCSTNTYAIKSGDGKAIYEGKSIEDIREIPRRCQAMSIEEIELCKWQRHARQLIARVLIQKGKSYIYFGKFEEGSKCYIAAMLILRISGCKLSSIWFSQHSTKPDIGVSKMECSNEVAALLYHMSCLLLWRRSNNVSSKLCCFADDNGMQPFAWLHIAFILSQNIPLLFQKVSRLLALLYAQTSPGTFEANTGKSFKETKTFAAFFHQASFGARTRLQHLTVLDFKLSTISQESGMLPMKSCIEEMKHALSIVQETTENPGLLIKEVMKGLPMSTVCCLSIIDKRFHFLLEDSIVHTNKTSAWLLISRIGVEDVHVMLLPIHCIPDYDKGRAWQGNSGMCPYELIDNDTESSSTEDENGFPAESAEHPASLNDVAEEFMSILKESRQSTECVGPVTTIEEKSNWWRWRTRLDSRLESFLCAVEETWLGPWKCLLLGDPLHSEVSKVFRKSAMELSKMISKKRKHGVDENLVKVLLQGVGCLTNCQLQRGIAWLLGWKDLYSTITELTNLDDLSEVEISKKCIVQDAAEAFVAAYESAVLEHVHSVSRKQKANARTRKASTTSKSAKTELISVGQDAVSLEREPMEIILDEILQGLPWESLPFLRKHEVYRMPSLGNIRALFVHHNHVTKLMDAPNKGKQTLNNSNRNQHKEIEKGAKRLEKPLVNPHNTFYLLNPAGDLGSTQVAFEDWFKQQKGWKGKAGQVPSVDDYIIGLQQHDMFVYLGHGSGEQYFSERWVRKLDHCAAMLLMGCSSGKFSFRGDYEPVGIVPTYITAGCPLAVANLWDVTDGDIDRFSRVLLQSWLTLEPETCQLDQSESPKCGKKKGRSSKTLDMESVAFDTIDTPLNKQIHVGITIDAGRRACKLPYLVGASPVCYGIPVVIKAQTLPED